MLPFAEPEVTLEQLLAGITEANVHREIDWGPAVGNEVWEIQGCEEVAQRAEVKKEEKRVSKFPKERPKAEPPTADEGQQGPVDPGGVT